MNCPSRPGNDCKRPARYAVKTTERDRPENVKEQVVKEREYRNIRLQSEDVAEVRYRPGACKQDYRMVVVRKNLSLEKGVAVLFDDIRYLFYITNDWEQPKEEIVFFANDRGNLHAPRSVARDCLSSSYFTASVGTIAQKRWM